jgi:Ca2+-binding RTX toxin-like protein
MLRHWAVFFGLIWYFLQVNVKKIKFAEINLVKVVIRYSVNSNHISVASMKNQKNESPGSKNRAPVLDKLGSIPMQETRPDWGASMESPLLRRAVQHKRRVSDEQEVVGSSSDGVVMSDVTGMVVAQLDSALLSGATSGASSAAASVTTTGLTAAGVTGTAAGAASAASALAASSATAVTTTTLSTAASVGSFSSLASVAGGAVALGAAAGGGGGGSGVVATDPTPVPPANPYPGPDAQTLDLGNSGDAHAVHRLSVDGAGLPAGILNKSLVIDLGANFGAYQGTLFYTDKTGDVVTTHVVVYRDVNNVLGTAVNDQISGHAGANVLDGAGGDDVIYGGGGLDTLRGGAGRDWVLFTPLTRGEVAGPYDDGVYVSLAGTHASLSGVVGIYRSASQTSGTFMEASSFEHAAGSQGADTLLGTDADNILVGFAGDDWLEGGDGNDQLFGGAAQSLGNQLLGGRGKDFFWAGYDLNPVLRALTITGTTELLSSPDAFDPLFNVTGISEVVNTSVVRDWNAAEDGLLVSATAVAVIGGLSGKTDWNGADVVDLRTHDTNLGVVNLGVIKVAAGAGSNEIDTTVGIEQLWVGYQYSLAGDWVDGMGSPVTSGVASDIIWGWDDQTNRRDQLHVALNSTAVIGLLQGKSDWDANDTVDLRQQVTNAGSIVVSTGVGNNTVYGSSGADLVYGSSGAGHYNQVWSGAGADVLNVGTNRHAADGALSTEVSKDLIWDYSAVNDMLNVSSSGVAVLALLDGLSNWDADNTVDFSTMRINNSGIVMIALGSGNDRFRGSTGADHVYGGASTVNGNQLWGGAGADRFYVGYNYNPLAGAVDDAAGRSELAPGETGVDVIHDWENGVDAMTIGSRGQAIVGGLRNVADWSGNDTVNVSTATNLGVIKLAAGTGTNNLYLSAGTDQVWSGYQFTRTGSGFSDYTIDGYTTPTLLTTSVDVLWGWDSQSVRRDQLNVSAQGTAAIASLLGMDSSNTRWDGNDTIDLRAQVNNAGLIKIAAGAGSNTLYGSSGNDHFHVGYTLDDSGNAQYKTGDVAIDTIYGWNAQAWTHGAFAGDWHSGTNWNGAAADDSSYDSLTVHAGSTARISSLSGTSASDATRWDGSQTVDLRSHVTNDGVIEIWTGSGSDYIYGSAGRDLIYSGPGMDNVWGGAGNDVFYAGYSPSWAPFGADAAEPRVWDWQNGIDGLRISANSYVVMSGLWGMDSTNANRWSGNDTVDLRSDVVNNGKIIVESSDGNDTIYGSSGVDWINPGAGYNTLDLSNGGNDRIYLDNFLTRTQISGFSADDRIYLDTRVLQSFIDQRHIITPAGYSITTAAPNLTSTDAISSGQYYDKGSFITSQLTYGATYNGTLQAYNADPKDPDFNVYGGVGDGILRFGWSTNGAWNNVAYESAYLTGKIAVIGAGSVSIAIGSSLAGIPFVGPFLAIPFWVNGGLMLNDGINNVAPYLNPVYSGGGVLDSGASTITADKATTSAVGTWNALNFLDFYDVKSSSGFVQSLEIAGQQPGYTAVPSGATVPGTNITFPYTYYQAPALTGVASYLAVYNGTNGTDGETFIYLVASRDALIQNNETILIAQVNGRVTADQLVMYNGGTDSEYLRYFNNTIEAPVFPPNPTIAPTSIIATAGDGKQVLYRVSYTRSAVDVVDYVSKSAYDTLVADAQLAEPTVTNLNLQGVYTNENSVSVTIAFDTALVASDVLKMYVGSTQVGANITGVTGSSYTVNLDISAVSDGTNTVTAIVSNAQGFESQGGVSFVRDTKAPNITDASSNMVIVTDTASSIIVTSNEPGVARLDSAAVKLTDASGNQATFTLAEQSSVTTQALSVEDIFGLSTALGSVTLGTSGNDGTALVPVSSSAQYVYGFGGDDVLTSSYAGANNLGANLYGGAGNDTLIGSVDKNNTFVGGAGRDILDLHGGNNTLIWNAVATSSGSVLASSDSNSIAKDHVYDFRTGLDTLMVVATGVNSVDLTTLQHTIADPYKGSTAAFTQLSINLDGITDATGTGDLVVEFAGTYAPADLLNALSFNLTGTSGADTLKGSVNADTFTGGAGADTFVFAAGDSTPTVSTKTVGSNSVTTVAGYDVITDMTLSEDIVDLSGVPAIATDTAGFNGIDSANIKSHSIVNGLLTFGGADAYASALDVNAFTLADAVAYLQANITGSGQAVVFRQDSHSYVFQHTSADPSVHSSDLLIQLSNITTVAGLTDVAHPVANYLFIA